MITNANTAKQISELMLDVFYRLHGSIPMVKETCSPEEADAYKKAIGRVVSRVVFDVLEPICERNPALKPANWDD